MKIWPVGLKVTNLLGTAAMSAVFFCPTAGADPIPAYCFDDRLCSNDFGSTYYCPDTGGWIGPFGACDALVTGPYAPGGLRPNQSNWDDEGDEW